MKGGKKNEPSKRRVEGEGKGYDARTRSSRRWDSVEKLHTAGSIDRAHFDTRHFFPFSVFYFFSFFITLRASSRREMLEFLHKKTFDLEMTSKMYM